MTVTPEDVAYLIEGFNHHFRTPLGAHDLLGQFVGVRPLLRSRADEPSSRSREYRLFTSPSGLLSVAGGKFTTYRHMAEVITDTLVERLGLRRHERTRQMPLCGTPLEPWQVFRDRTVAGLEREGLSASAAWHLVHRYGRHAEDVMQYIRRAPGLAQPIHPEESDLCAELLYQRDHEMAIYPADFLLRRTRIGLFHPERLQQPLAA
jgi:glycerol-3-phosphate dehydrogenase